MNSRIKLLVNAIPLAKVNTGISRYLWCLYSELERLFGDRLEIGYFDGVRVSSTMPRGPTNLNRWAKAGSLFWKLPPYPALMVRLAFHVTRETLFRRCSGHYDLYHEAGFFPFAVPHNLKTIFTIHDLSLIRFPEYHPRERVLYSRLFLQRRCKTVDHFLAVSEFTAGEMQSYLSIDPEKITVTHLAHNDKLFSPGYAQKIGPILKRQALPEKYFLFVGGGDPRKNLDIIPEALEKAGIRIPLVVVGWSAGLYSSATALIFPSRYEGFGLPILEAMACGCPVVTTREASLPEVAGEAALYLNDARNRAELGHLLNKLAASSPTRAELGRRGRIQAGKFSWEKTARATFQVFLEVLNR